MAQETRRRRFCSSLCENRTSGLLLTTVPSSGERVRYNSNYCDYVITCKYEDVLRLQHATPPFAI